MRLIGGIFAVLALSLTWAFDFPFFEQQILARFGPGRLVLLREWQASLADARKSAELEKLRKVNDFINQHVDFDEDSSIYNHSDYWATPLETVGHGRADCEDFAIIKYFSLKDAGVAISKLRLVYVKARLAEVGGPRLQAHMVLAYYATPNAEPLVLDNLVTEILPASQRKDLQPVFSFNSEAVWNGVAGNSAKGKAGTGQLSRWQDLLLRARKEGFD
ncbi:MAG: transglutaminase-like cysteine peptidase [Rhodocyclales bacterium]|nr:transglutaminase-like cysteine peptidase [Rhodocyclales bacterium]